MESIEAGKTAIVAYLRQIKFRRKTFGGIDPESALDELEHVTELYNAFVENLHGMLLAERQENDNLRAQLERTRQTPPAQTYLPERPQILFQPETGCEPRTYDSVRETYESERQLNAHLAALAELARRHEDIREKLDDLELQMQVAVYFAARELGITPSRASG
jgi:hypothetical protein